MTSAFTSYRTIQLTPSTVVIKNLLPGTFTVHKYATILCRPWKSPTAGFLRLFPKYIIFSVRQFRRRPLASIVALFLGYYLVLSIAMVNLSSKIKEPFKSNFQRSQDYKDHDEEITKSWTTQDRKNEPGNIEPQLKSDLQRIMKPQDANQHFIHEPEQVIEVQNNQNNQELQNWRRKESIWKAERKEAIYWLKKNEKTSVGNGKSFGPLPTITREELLNFTSSSQLYHAEERILADFVSRFRLTWMERSFMNVEAGNFDPEDVALLKYLRRRIPMAIDSKSSARYTVQQKMEENLAVTPPGDIYDPIFSMIMEKYFDNDFNRKAFIQVGARNNNGSCWETQIHKNRSKATLWSGLVMEMDHRAIEQEKLYTRIAPFCVSPENRPTFQLLKTFLHERPFKAQENGSNNEGIPYKSTIISLGDLRDLSGRPGWMKFTHLQIVPVNCFPLWSIMVAANVTDCDFLTISSAGNAGKIAETLPWGRMSPKVVHLTDLGDGESTRRLLEYAGYELDTELSTLGQQVFPGNFVFFKR